MNKTGKRSDLLKAVSEMGLPRTGYEKAENAFFSWAKTAPPGVVYVSYPLNGGSLTLKRTLEGSVVAHVYPPGNEYSLSTEERSDHRTIRQMEKEVLEHVRERMRRLHYANHELTGEGVPGLGYIGTDKLLLGFREQDMLSGNQGLIEIIGHWDTATVTIETGDGTLRDITEFRYPKRKRVEKVR